MKKVSTQPAFRKLRIVSYRGGLVSLPPLDEEVSQSLTIHRDGRVWFSGYTYAENYLTYNRCRSSQNKVQQEKLDELFRCFEQFFTAEYTDSNVLDAGLWELAVLDASGETKLYKGSLCDALEVDGVNLSVLVREVLDRDDLWVFDGAGTQ